MKFGSLFSGVGGMDLGMERAGWECAWQVEKEPYRRAVLKTHWPEVPKYEDVKTVGAGSLSTVDLVAAGVPCQDVSIAGKRRGLAGARTGLFFEFARILTELRPSWFLFENVPGLLSSHKGRDFAIVLQVLMGECGYGVAWRCLNSRHFGVAQNRSRVFLVGSLGRPCPQRFFLSPRAAAGILRRALRRGRRLPQQLREVLEGLVAAERMMDPISSDSQLLPIGQKEGPAEVETENGTTLPLAFRHNASSTQSMNLSKNSPALKGSTSSNQPAVVLPTPSEPATDTTATAVPKAMDATTLSVRRLMPTECEALQGFPRGWTVPATEHWATRLQSRSRSGSDVES